MSTATISQCSASSALNSPTHLTHQPHTAHPLPLREQAFTLHCQGLRSLAIAQELDVPERTIRAWIASALATRKDDLPLSRKEQLLLAVERQHQLTATAWQQFKHEAAARAALLDAALDILLTAANTADAADLAARSVNLHLHLPASTPAPCSLLPAPCSLPASTPAPSASSCRPTKRSTASLACTPSPGWSCLPRTLRCQNHAEPPPLHPPISTYRQNRQPPQLTFQLTFNVRQKRQPPALTGFR